MKTLHLDFESFCPLDLKKVGVENYIRHPDFAVTALAWAFDGDLGQVVAYPNCSLPPEVRAHIHEGRIIKAWNAAFEWNILTYHYGLNVAHEAMDCVMQRALAFGLPASLQAAGDAMKAGIVKDATARKLMLTMSKPKKDGTTWHQDQSLKAVDMLCKLALYCRQDVLAERALDKMIPPLADFEKKLSVIDARINESGIPIDMAGVHALMAAAYRENYKLAKECQALTGGMVQSPGTERDKLLAWLATQGLHPADLTKETVAILLKGAFPPNVIRVLELRQLAAKASLAKLQMMAGWASSHDGRARNGLQFYGAGRTGRWAGRGIQVQNMPRTPKGWDAQKVMDLAAVEPGALGLFYEKPLAAIAYSVRGCLTARPGHVLVSIDLSQIEARVLAWLAGQNDVLDLFRRGVDIYTITANKHGSADRQLGKVLVLACGFQMGAAKFRDTAEKDYGVVMTLAEAIQNLTAWRRDNRQIVQYWGEVWGMVQNAVRNPGKEFWLRYGVAARMQGPHLQLRKPNGVKLTYHNMRMVNGGLVFDGVNSKTKKWGVERTYGGRLVENLVQSTARDVMASGILNAGTLPIATVHDEIVWEVPETTSSAEAAYLQGAVNQGTPWTSGLPIASEVKISWRYSK